MMTMTMTNGADAQFTAKMAKELAEATRVVKIEKSGGQAAVAPGPGQMRLERQRLQR